jgi:hypothetical protein
VERAARTADSHGVHGLSRAAANETDSRRFLQFTCAAALAGLLAIPRLVRPCRSPDWTFELSSDSFPSPRASRHRRRHRGCPPHRRLAVRIATSDERRPSWASLLFRVLVPSPWSGVFRPPLLGFVPVALIAPDIAAVAMLAVPDLSAPPSTSSPASTPTMTSLPPLWSRGANLAIAFRPHRFARSRRFSPPIAPLSRDFALLPAQDSRACCIPLPILGFAAFLFVVRVAPAPHTGHVAMVCVQPVTRTPRPRSAVHTLWRIPLIRSRVVSPRPLPP